MVRLSLVAVFLSLRSVLRFPVSLLVGTSGNGPAGLRIVPLSRRRGRHGDGVVW